MDNLSIIIQAKLNAVQSGQAINQQIQSLEKQLAPLQLKLDTATSVKDIKILADGTQQLQKHILGATDSYGNQVKIVQKLNAETDKMVVSQLKLTENNNLYNASLMKTQALKNAYNKQMFSNFNQSLGIGVVDPNRITSSNSALREYYANMDRISRVSTIRTSDAINNSFLLQPNRINASNSALREYYTQIDRVSRVSTVGTSEAIGNSFNNFRNLDTNRITSANSALAQLFTNSNRNVNSMTELERRVVSLNPAMTNLNRQAHESAQSFGSSATKMLQWSIIGTAIFGTIRQISSGFKYIYELENSLNEVRIVTGQTQEQVESLAVSYNKLGKEMSVTTRELTSTAADLFRQGLDNNQVEDRMKAIVTYAKISSISLEESNKIITATANATGESVTKIIDVFSLLGDTTASGAAEIGEAMQRVASASDNSNISLEKSASWLATISSITRESASTIGRSLNSVISRYESIKKTGFNSDDETKLNDVVEALSDIGIKATDSQGQLLDFATVMDAVGSKFNSLEKNEKAYIATTMFGTFQRNRGITLLNNYQDSLKNYENALNSSGTADEKFAIRQESSAAALDRLKVSWENFWQSTVGTDFIKGGLNSLSSFIDTFGNLKTIIIAVTTAMLIFKGTDITNWFRTSTIATQGFRASIITTRGTMIGLTEAEIATRVATNGLTLSVNALKVAFMSNPIGMIATVILVAVSAFDILKQKQKENAQEAEQVSQKLSQEQEALKGLSEEYTKIIQSGDLTAESKSRLKGIQDELIKTYGVEAKEIDLVNGKYEEQIVKINEASVAKARSQLASMGNSGQDALENLKAEGTTQVTFGSSRKATEINSILSSVVGDSVGLDNENKQLYEINGTLEKRVEILGKVSLALGSVQDKDKFTKQLIQEVSDEYNKLNGELEKTSSLAGKYVENKFIDDFKTDIDTALIQMAKLKANPEDKSIADVLDKLKTKMEATAKTSGMLPYYKKYIDDFFGNVPEKAGNASDNTDKFTKSLKTLQETMASSASAISEIQSEIDSYNETGKFSLDNLVKLSAKYPELLTMLDDEAKIRDYLTQKITEEQDKSRQAYIAMISDSTDFYNANITGIQTMVEGLRGARVDDLEGAKDLASAKLKVELSLIKNLAGLWSDYYNAQTGAFTGEFENVAGHRVVSGGKNGESTAVSDLMMNQLGDLANQSAKASKAFDDIALKGSGIDFSKIGMSGSKGSSGSGSSKADSEKAQSTQSLTDALLAQIKVESDLQKAKTESISKELEQSKSQKDYAKSLELTNALIASQSAELSILNSSRTQVNQLKDQSIASSKFGDTARWYTGEDNSESEIFVKEKNASSDEIRTIMDEEFKSMQALRNSWLYYTKAIKENAEQQKESQAIIKQIHQDEINSLLELSKARMSLLTEGTSEYDAELSKQIALYNELLETQDKLSAEYLNTQNTIKSLLTSDLSSKHTEIIDNINKKLEEHTKKLDETLSSSESRIQKYTSTLSNIDNSISLLQTSDYADKTDLLNDAIDKSSDKANRLASEYYRLSQTTVYSKEDAEKLEQQLKSLKDEMNSTNQQTIEYVKTLEQNQFSQITSEAKLAQDEIDRLTSIINSNSELLKDGMLSGTSLSFDFSMPDGKTLDLSSITNNSLDNIIDIEVKVDESLQNQLENAEDHYTEMLEMITTFFETILGNTDTHNTDIENTTDTSLNNQYSGYENFYSNLSSLIETSMKNASETQKGYLQTMLDNVNSFNASIANSTTTISTKTPSPNNTSSGNLANGNTIKYNNGPTGWTEYDKNGNVVGAGTSVRNDIIKHAKGTPQGGTLSDELAIVDDEGTGKREIIVTPDGKMLLGDNSGPKLINLAKGSQVIPNKETEEILKRQGIPAYESGTGTYVETSKDSQGGTVVSVTNFIDTTPPETIAKVIAEAGRHNAGDFSVGLDPLRKADPSSGRDRGGNNSNTTPTTTPTTPTTKPADVVESIVETSNQTYQEAIDSVTEKISAFQTIYTDSTEIINDMQKDGSGMSQEKILSAQGKVDYAVNENSFLWNDELLKAKEQSARDAIDALSEYLKDTTLTEDTQNQVKEEIQAQNDIISSSLQQRKTIVKNFFDYQQSLRDKDLQVISDSQDDIQHKLNMLDDTNEKNYPERIKLSNAMADSEKDNLELLKQQSIELKSHLSDYKVGSYEWNLINAQVKTYGELIEDSEEAIVDMGDALSNIYNDIADQVIDAYKSAYKKQEEIALESINKQKDAYDELIDYKIKALSDSDNLTDYNEDLANNQEKIRETQSKIDALSLDDSIEAKAKRLELSKELTEQQQAIATKQRKRDTELQTKSLQEQQKNNSKAVESQIETTTNYYEGLIDNDAKYAEIRKNIYAGSFADIQADFDKFNTYFSSQTEETLAKLGLNWQSLLNIINQVNSADIIASQTAANAAQQAKADVPYDPETETAPTETNTVDPNAVSLYKVWNVRGSSTNPDAVPNVKVTDSKGNIVPITVTKSNANNFAVTANQPYIDGETYIIKAGTLTKVFTASKNGTYRAGGETQSTGMHWLDGESGRPERVLSAVQTASFNDLVKNLPSITSIMDKIITSVKLPSFNVPDYSGISKQIAQTSMEFNFDSLINVQGNIDKDSLPSMKDIATYTINELNKTFNRKGILR